MLESKFEDLRKGESNIRAQLETKHPSYSLFRSVRLRLAMSFDVAMWRSRVDGMNVHGFLQMECEKHVSYTLAGNAAGGSVQERVALSLCKSHRAIYAVH